MESGGEATGRQIGRGHTDALHDELHRRIEELRAHHDDDFGRFHALDWALIVVGCVLVPLALYVWFLP
jgi:hypothetical protein